MRSLTDAMLDDLLERAAIADKAAAPEAPAPAAGPNGHGQQRGDMLDIGAYLAAYDIPVVKTKRHGSATLHVLGHCLFDSSHTRGESAIGQAEDGKLFFQCFHSSCASRTWPEAREKISGSDNLGRFMPGRRTSGEPGRGPAPAGKATTEPPDNQKPTWKAAEALFPRIPFPWHVLPPALADSLQQLARSCASGADHLPGVALCILSSVIGRALEVSPKTSWKEPLTIWLADIRASGEGKTPTSRQLLQTLEDVQAKAHAQHKAATDSYERDLAQWHSMAKGDRAATPMPTPPGKERGYFITNLTLEGLHDELDGHPTGGIVVVQDELSSFVSSMNQYKGKGSDRESWLCLHDGKPARVRRAGKVAWIAGSRVSMFGGIQPGVFQRTFGGEGGLLLEDGTLYRFLLTYTPPEHHELTAESWNDANRAAWERLIAQALEFASAMVDETTGEINTTHRLLLDHSAQGKLFSWRNSMDTGKTSVPPSLRGFISKAAGQALRLAGVLHALRVFARGDRPSRFLSAEDIERGISVLDFYLGQTVDALQLVEDSEHAPPDTSERVKHLAETLAGIRDQTDSGRLAIGFILERFNVGIPKEKQIGKPKAMGALLRSVGLTIDDGRHHANGRHGVLCLAWDSRTENFLKRSPQSPPSPPTQAEQDCAGEDIKNSCPQSPQGNSEGGRSNEDFEDIKNSSPHPQSITSKGSEDIEDIEDQISDSFKNSDAPDETEEF